MPRITETASIDTARARLRPMTVDAAVEVHRLWTEPLMRRRIWNGEEVAFEQSLAVVERSVEFFETRGVGLWCAWDRLEDLLIGFSGFWFFDEVPEPQIVFGLSEQQVRRGFAREILHGVLSHAFDYLGFERVVAVVSEAPIRRLLVEMGFRFDRRAILGGRSAKLYATDRRSFQADAGAYSLLPAPKPLLHES